MNKLFIIGNGFDLAHGLPTSYSNFMDAFWKNIKKDYKKEEIKDIIYINEMYNRIFDYKIIENYEDLKSNLERYSIDYSCRYNKEDHTCSSGSNIIFEFKNDFFKNLNKIKSIRDWVDIENEYYRKLKKLSKIGINNTNYLRNKKKSKNEINLEDYKKEKVTKLNNEFCQIKNLLEKYLDNEIIKKFDFEFKINLDGLNKYLLPISIYNKDWNRINEEFSDNNDKIKLQVVYDTQKNKGVFETDCYFLNFNYTSTLAKYINSISDSEGFKLNYIHGKVGDSSNPINFGFGDEMDEDYRLIENLNENEYLKNFKSFQYLQNSNYNDLIKHINSEKYQVCILGHSCGLSDRTLLNTIFEHKNCRSIKVFYHKGEQNDNYTDIIQNISRHFDDKKMMREKIVNKSLCSPLPQMQLSKIEI